MTPRELNYGAAMYGASVEAMDLLDMIGQGRGDLYCARLYARLHRSIGNPDCDMLMWPVTQAVGLVAAARRVDHRMTDDKAADLASFIIERGVNLIERRAS